MLTDRQRQIINLRDNERLTWDQIAEKAGCARSTAVTHYNRAKEKLSDKKARLDPGVHKVLDKLGMGDTAGQHSGWVHKEDPDTGEWASVYYFLGKDGQPCEADLEEVLAGAVERVMQGSNKAFPARPDPKGENLLVIDIADLHIGKLCVKSETGYSYDREIALHRGREGAKAILAAASKHGIAHILFVIGNDIVHIDKPGRTTTTGTPQDTDGSLAVMFDDALAFYVEVLDLCRAVAPVSLIYCPSNHDWMAGYFLAQSLKAYYRECPEVSATDYNTSLRHRKYFRYEGNLIGVTHGDGAKEADLVALMMQEAAEHLGGAKRRYWYLHHLHHKIQKRGAGSQTRQIEKDLIGMTVIRDAAGLDAGDLPQIEYLRSPSPPDGWHDRNGYVNGQAVEAFLHCPRDGVKLRLTEWF
jgi:hypothetical protein